MMGKLHLLWYLLAVFQQLPGSWKQKKKILTGISNIVRDYVTENPNADYNAILKRFGTPRKIAESYVVEMEPEVLLNQIQIRHRMLFGVVISVAIAATIWSVFTVAAYIDHFNDMDGFAIVEIIEGE